MSAAHAWRQAAPGTRPALRPLPPTRRQLATPPAPTLPTSLPLSPQLIVAYSLTAAGVRYTIVGVFLAVVLVYLQPGRWWF